MVAKSLSVMTTRELEECADSIREHIESVIGPDAYIDDYCEAPDIIEWMEVDGRFDTESVCMRALLNELAVRERAN